MTRRTVYLSGPIEKSDDPATWREDIEEEFQNINFINPLDMGFEPYEEMYEMVWTQMKVLRRVDFMLVNYQEGVETYGTPIEMFWCFITGTPVVTWSITDIKEMPAYALVFSDYVSDDVGECIDVGWGYNSY